MKTNITVNGREIKVVLVENNETFFARTGGACVMAKLPKYAWMFSDDAKLIMSLEKEMEGVCIDDVVIFMDKKLKTLLTEEEFNAVFDHEVGHVVKGHIFKGCTLSDIDQELEADAYSAAIHGNAVMGSALNKITKKTGHNHMTKRRLKALGVETGMSTFTKLMIGAAVVAVAGYVYSELAE